MSGKRTGSLGRILLIILFVVVLALGVSIGYFNAQTVQFDYLAGTVSIGLIWLLLGVMGGSILLSLIICGGRIFELKNENRRLKRKLKDSDSELRSLRELPIKEGP
ncbi:MAG: LapA family protein [Pseudomonadota bacterium]|nr:LapA family protein [Gammaproteobacteria bacterium]MEC9357770.1 LapA family protein [Pseudomonadota bacterium]